MVFPIDCLRTKLSWALMVLQAHVSGWERWKQDVPAGLWPHLRAHLPSCTYLHMVESTCKEPICPICWINSIPNVHVGVVFSTEMGLVYFLVLLVVGPNLDLCLIFQRTSYAQECWIVELIIKSRFPRCLERKISDILIHLCNPFCLAFVSSSLEQNFLDLSPVFLVALLVSFFLRSWAENDII